VVEEQIHTFRNEGHHVTLACFEGGYESEAHSHVPLSRAASRQELVAYLSSALSGVDCVLMHNVGTMPFAPELTAALQQLPALLPASRWICWVHDLAIASSDYTAALEGENGELFKQSVSGWEYVAVSALRQREVEELLRVHCAVVPNGVDPVRTLQLGQKVARLAESCGWWDADAVLLNPSRLLPRKTVENGIQIARVAASLGLNIQYVVTGASDPHNGGQIAYVKRLKQLCETLQVSNSVHFISDSMEVGPQELCDIYKVADAVFLPGVKEGFGLPVLEAGVFGKPVFCPDSEPLSSLPGAISYPSKMAISDMARWLIRQIEGHHSITARRKVLKDYRWPSIYRNHLAPLLERAQAFTSPEEQISPV
ncbi:MAG: glycosyltransferase family 1 protein, partial [Verrucomicrobia bacterium]|nr:glycosyltransferase family 1 protein [Verrucomicrobiota bacterium]